MPGSMHKSISQFRSMWKNGIASPTRYVVQTLREGLLWVFPETVTLPSRSFSLFTDGIYGSIRQYPYRRLYNDQIVMTFLVDNKQSIRVAMEGWMNSLISPTETVSPDSTNARTYNMFIYTLGANDELTSVFRLKGVYPLSIIPSNYGHGMLNETAKLQVTFNYRNYEFDTNAVKEGSEIGQRGADTLDPTQQQGQENVQDWINETYHY